MPLWFGAESPWPAERPRPLSISLALAQISDLHLTLATPGLREAIGKRGLSLLSRVAGWRRRHDMQVADRLADDLAAHAPDLIAVTGDLVHLSLPAEFDAARPWLSRLCPPERLCIVPGNHEALVRGWEAPMHAAWRGALGGDDGSGFPWRRRVGGAVVIGLCSAVATPPLLATGRIGPEQLQVLRRLLDDAAREGMPAVVLVHHPPTPVLSPRKSLSDGAALRRVLAEGGAALVLHGHAHRALMSWIDGPHGRIPVLGAPSGSAPPDGPIDPGGWSLFRFSSELGGLQVTLQERRIAGGGGVETGRRLIFDLPVPGPRRAAA